MPRRFLCPQASNGVIDVPDRSLDMGRRPSDNSDGRVVSTTSETYVTRRANLAGQAEIIFRDRYWHLLFIREYNKYLGAGSLANIRYHTILWGRFDGTVG